MEIDEVLADVKREVVPSPEEKNSVERLRDKILKEAHSVIGDRYSIEPLFCGSIAKDTWLSGHKDLDLFLLFPERVAEDDLERVGLKVSKEIVKNLGGRWEINYAEHPYLMAEVQGHDLDIVPAYDVEDPSDLKSSVDRTPYHVRYVREHLDRNLIHEVRLLKKFCSGAGVYGSDLKTQGFSGYLCELLIIEYGTLKSLLEEASEWSPGVAIDVEGHYEEGEIEDSFPKEPLIVVDPVDADRNVASVLSLENFLVFRRHARQFLEDPQLRFFFQLPVMPPDPEEIEEHIEERGTRLVLIRFDTPNVIEDVLWPQLRKATRRLRNELEDNEFEVLRTGVWSGDSETVIVLELLVDELPKIKKQKGPSAFDGENSDKFLEHYRGYNVFVEGENWMVEYDRDYQNAIDLIKDMLRGDEGQLRDIGIPSYIAARMHEDVEVATGSHISRLLRRYQGLRKYMKGYFHKDLA